MSYIDEYRQRRNRICGLLTKASTIFTDINEKEALNLAEIEKATAEGKFSVVVVGQFSAGKSTFLNALMGEKYLPSFTKETTATINELKSIKESPIPGVASIRVNFRDGRSEISDDVSLDNIKKYVCTDGDDVINKVASVELFLDSPFLNNGVRLIDTPGLNGIAEGHKEVTYGKLGQTHASIFMFCAGIPGSKTDFNLLKDVKDSGSSILFVLNQIDLIKEDEGESPESVISNIRRSYAEKFDDDVLPEIWPVSSYEALVARNSKPLIHHSRTYETKEDRKTLLEHSRMKNFEDRLMKYLTLGERSKAELLSPVNQLYSKITNTLSELRQQLSLLNSDVSVAELQEQKNRLEEEIAEVKKKNSKSIFSVRSKVSDIITDTENSIKSDSRDIRNTFIAFVEKSEGDLEEFEMNSRSFLRRMENQYRDAMDMRLNSMVKTIKRLIEENFEEYSQIVRDHMHEDLNAISLGVKSASIDASYFDIDLDLNLDEELDEISNRLYEASMEASEEAHLARVAEANLKDLDRTKSELDKVKIAKRDSISSLGCRPEGEERVKTVSKKKGGMIGLFKWIGTGSREYYAQEYYLDFSRQKDYDEKVKSLRGEFEQEISDISQRYESLRGKDTDVEKHRHQEILKNAEIESLTRKRDAIIAKRDKTIEKELRKRCRAAKSYIESVLEEIDKNYRDAAIRELNDREESISKAVTQIIDAVLSVACEDKQRKLSAVIEKLESGAEELEKERNTISERINSLDELQKETVELRRELEDLVTDTIENIL